MSAIVNFKNVQISGNARVLNNGYLSQDTEINIEGGTITDNVVFLENLQIPQFCAAVEKAENEMTPAEHASIQRVIAQRDGNRKEFLTLLGQHLVSFAEGVAASIVASLMLK